ncbi:EXPH5 protein, partial [Brachypteracias leptosomus]|nr:EXPH5 protein [Brachypteracias leptosomus]
QAEVCNSAMSAETSGLPFDANQNEMMEKSTQEWNEQLEKEIFSVLNDLDDQLAQEQAQDPLDRTVSTSSESNVQYSAAFPNSKRQTASRGQHRSDWSDIPSTFFPDGLRTIRAKDEHRIFIRPRKLHNAYINWHKTAFQEDYKHGDPVGGNPHLLSSRMPSVSFGQSSEGSLYPPSVTRNSGFRHKSCMNRDTAGRSYSVCSLRRCLSSVSSDQLSASSLQHPLPRESNNDFVPRFGRQNPKRTPLSSIVWNNTPDSPGQTPTQENMFRTRSLMEFHATDHSRYPSSLQETKKYSCYQSKHHYRRSISSSTCFSRVSCPDKATSPVPFDNWENYPFHKLENNLSRSYYKDTSSHGNLYANSKESYGKDSYLSWADIPQHYSDETFTSPDASFEVVMANLDDQQWAHTKNAKFGSQRLQNDFHISPQNGNSGNIYMHRFDGDPKTSEHSLSYFCYEKESGKITSTSPCTERLHKQDGLQRQTSSCSMTGSPSRNSPKSPDPLVIYYTLPRKSASIAGSIMSDTAISLPRESRRTYDYNPEDADLPCPKENTQSPRIQNTKNEGHVRLADNNGSDTSLEIDMSLDSLISTDSHQPLLQSDKENQNHTITTRSKNSQTPGVRLEGKSQPISPSTTTAGPLDDETRRASSRACSPPLPLFTDKNLNVYVNSCLQADLCPEQNLTAQTVFGQCQNNSQSASLKNANLHSSQMHKSHAKSQRERHLSEGICARDYYEAFASESSILPKDGGHGKRFKSYSELLSCDENENWAPDDEKCYSTRNLMYPSVEFGIFGKEQQLAFLENIKRSLTEGRLWKPCLLNNPGALRDGEAPSINRAELLSSSSAGSKMSSAASSPRELTDIYQEDPAAYSDSDSDTTTDDEYYLDEMDKESEL